MPDGAQWRVIGTVPATGRDSSNQFVAGWNVTYQLSSGPTGNVFVAKAGYTRDALRAAIAADAATLDDIANLTSG